MLIRSAQKYFHKNKQTHAYPAVKPVLTDHTLNHLIIDLLGDLKKKIVL